MQRGFYLLILHLSGVRMGIVEVPEFWPEIADDLTVVVWSHATNTMDMLETAIEDDTMMIEADVSVGEGGAPIMAHPPDNTSDLTLLDFLNTVIAASKRGIKKGMKLDFKYIEIVAPSLSILKTLESELQFPVWLNADILPGPGGSSTPVDADSFLSQVTQHFPTATLSIGYTTSAEGKYTKEQLQQMFDILKGKNITAPVTLPLRACLAARSIPEITEFMKLVDQDGSFPTTITIWSSAQDEVDHEQLDKLISQVGKNRLYLDVPWGAGSEDRPTNSSSISSSLTMLTFLASLIKLKF